MKKIKKLKLINWHFFDNQEFVFSDINVITGENGTGKSTILDAIHYLQSGGACKFNYAANSLSSGRTVENYLKARIGGEKQEFLRDTGDVIGHIAIEYENTTSRKPFVLGCVLQLSNGQLVSPTFYKIDGEPFSDDLFFTKETEVKNYDELEKTAKSLGLPFSIIGQKRQGEKARKKAVLEALGVGEKYEVLFAKAIGFEPLQDISRFATDFLLPETKLDLSSIKDSMDAYRDIKYQVETEKTRADELKPIIDQKDRYEESLMKEAALKILLDSADIQIRKSQIAKNEEQIRIEQIHIDDFDRQAENARKQAAEEERAAEAILSSDEFKEIEKLTRRKTDLENDLADVNAKISSWEKMAKNESNLARRVGTSFDCSSIFARHDYEAYLSTLSAYKERLTRISEDNDDERSELNALIKEQRLTCQGLLETIDQLNSNLQAYEPFVTKLSEEIKSKVKNQFGPQEQVEPTCLCAFLEINDPEWRDAVEGLLDKRRFDFFVKKDHYPLAKMVFEENASLKEFFGVGVIRLDGEDHCAAMGSLAEKIDTYRVAQDGTKKELHEPRMYVNFLLGDVYCVDSPVDFKQGVKAITRDGIYFDGQSIRHVSASAIKKPYIGQESKKRRLEDAKNELDKLNSELKENSSRYENLRTIFVDIQHSRSEQLLEQPNHWARLAEIKEGIDSAVLDIAKLESINGDLERQNKVATEHKNKAKLLRNQAAKLDDDKIQSAKKVGSLSSENDNLAKQISDKESSIRSNRESFPKSDIDLDTYLDSLSDGKTAQSLRDHAWQLGGTVANQKQISERTIKNAIALYCSNHPGELVNDISNYMDFVRRYNKIVSDNLAKLQPELEDAYQRSVSELREHFISRIRSSLDSAKQTIGALNRTLRKHPFGTEEEIYEFVTSKSRDRILGGVYHIAMETNQDTVMDNLFAESLDMEGQEIMNKVFEVLSKPDDDPETRDFRREITDYRSYLHYDIRIKVHDGNDRLYSSNYDAKSGGETQTPFYALIAGAFQSILADNEKNGRSPVGLVLFDEAFNNMDGARIKQMLEFYKELNVQLIISVPSSRLSYISPYVDNITCLAKDEYAVAVYQTRSTKDA